MYSSYAKMGNQCSSQTIALTSNTKFYKPFDEIYYTDWRRTFILNNNSIKMPPDGSKQQIWQQHISPDVYKQFNVRNN